MNITSFAPSPEPEEIKQARLKRNKVQGVEVSPMLYAIETRHDLELRIFNLEQRVKELEHNGL